MTKYIQRYPPSRQGPLKSSSLLSSEVVEEVSLGLEVLDVRAVGNNSLLLLEGQVGRSVEVGETPLLGDDDLLSSRELVSSSSESLDDNRSVDVLASDGDEDLADVDSSDLTVRLTPSTSHTKRWQRITRRIMGSVKGSLRSDFFALPV